MAKYASDKKFKRESKLLKFKRNDIYLDIEDCYVFNYVVTDKENRVCFRSGFDLNIPVDSIDEDEIRSLLKENWGDGFIALQKYFKDRHVEEINDFVFEKNFDLVDFIMDKIDLKIAR